MVKVKICGLSRPCDIEAANAEKPDYIGFVFAESRRKVSRSKAADLRRLMLPEIIPVGVFVNESIENILSLIHDKTIDIVQLHGSEDEEYIHELKTQTDKPIIKAINVQSKGDVQRWSETSADFLLLDHENGGTGQSFDWMLIGYSHKPYFLAGGLNPQNITDAISKTSPYCVDASSGVESTGVKDLEKISEFIRRARNEC